MKVTAHRVWLFDLRAAAEPIDTGEDEEETGGNQPDDHSGFLHRLGGDDIPRSADQLQAAASNFTDTTEDEDPEDDDDDDVEPGEEYITRLITSRTATLNQAVQIFEASRELLGIGEDDEILAVKLEGEANHVTKS